MIQLPLKGRWGLGVFFFSWCYLCGGIYWGISAMAAVNFCRPPLFTFEVSQVLSIHQL